MPIFTNISSIYNSFIILLKYFSVNLHEFSVKFISNSYVEWWYCISRQSVQYRQPHYSPFKYATSYMICFCVKVWKLWLIWLKFVNSMNPYLLSMQAIASFVSWRQHSNIRRCFCLQRCVRYFMLSSELFGVHSITWCLSVQ